MNLPFIISNDYETPEEDGAYGLLRKFSRSSVVFYLKYLKIVITQRQASLKGIYDDEAWAKSSLDIFRIIEKCGGKFKISGLNNLKKADGPVVFISNHMGTLETMIFPFLIAPVMPVTFVVKESLVKNKIFGPIMRSRNPITVSRTNSREDLLKVLQEGTEKLQAGVSIIIFPQSTRQLEFHPEKFNTLGTKLAVKGGVRVIPIAIRTDFWGNGKRIKELGPINRNIPIHMNFGAPIAVTGSGKEAHQAVLEHISQNLENWKS